SIGALTAERDGAAAAAQQLREQNEGLLQQAQRLLEQVGRSQDRSQQLEAETEQLTAARAAASERLTEPEHSLTNPSRRLQGLLGELARARTGHETLRREHGSLQEQRIELESRAHELMLILRDRERWIAALLHEVAGRRLKLRGRGLLPHESEFLAR